MFFTIFNDKNIYTCMQIANLLLLIFIWYTYNKIILESNNSHILLMTHEGKQRYDSQLIQGVFIK